ncbi:helix-turn-helix domain-containing protein [Dactylosporangium darangshiense]|uniref:helix-turn-helix domain-containing protein n=1 Tax=Dactylosporangium darangshiense TaxID=579108 RepID=UPI003640AC0B
MTHPYARELGDFLRARRGRLRPHDVGLEPGGRRKVAGLRREELALLAGLSTDYYQRMEQGREVHPSDDILEALAGALGLDDEERRHLFTLARAAAGRCPPGWTTARSGCRTARGGCCGCWTPRRSCSAGTSTCSPGTRWRRRCSATRPRTRPTGSTCSC